MISDFFSLVSVAAAAVVLGVLRNTALTVSDASAVLNRCHTWIVYLIQRCTCLLISAINDNCR